MFKTCVLYKWNHLEIRLENSLFFIITKFKYKLTENCLGVFDFVKRKVRIYYII